MRKIIRVEDKNGIGMFRSETLQKLKPNNHDIIMNMLYRHNSFNTPQQDPGIQGLFSWHHHFCAYKSMEQFERWVTPEEKRVLVLSGFKILVLTVSDCLVGQDQIVFERPHIMSCEDISDLFL